MRRPKVMWCGDLYGDNALYNLRRWPKRMEFFGIAWGWWLFGVARVRDRTPHGPARGAFSGADFAVDPGAAERPLEAIRAEKSSRFNDLPPVPREAQEEETKGEKTLTRAVDDGQRAE